MSGVRVVPWDRATFSARRDEVLDVYAEAMQVPPVAARARRPVIAGHVDRKGLRAVAAVDQRDSLVGIAYGYVGGRGQWWHDHVRSALVVTLGDEPARRWLDGAFEVCELHVRPAAQRSGLGRRLLDTLLEDQPSSTAVLTTPDAETRARGFYRSAGWVDLVRNLVFPGDPRPFAVLGLRLPPPKPFGSHR
jgi:ribosomal protein S18 acetylase RimI-like enzyme